MDEERGMPSRFMDHGDRSMLTNTTPVTTNMQAPVSFVIRVALLGGLAYAMTGPVAAQPSGHLAPGLDISNVAQAKSCFRKDQTGRWVPCDSLYRRKVKSSS